MDSESSEEDLQPRTSSRPTPAPFCQPSFTPSVPDVSLIFNDDLSKSNSSRNVFKNSSLKSPAVVAADSGVESYNAWKYKNSKALQESAKENSKNVSPPFKHHAPLPNYSFVDHDAGDTVSRNSSTDISQQPSESVGPIERNAIVNSGENVIRKDTALDISFGMAPLQPAGYAVPKRGVPTDSFQQLRSLNQAQSFKPKPLTNNFSANHFDKASDHNVNSEPRFKANAYESYLNAAGKSLIEHSQRPVNSTLVDGRDSMSEPKLPTRFDYNSRGNRSLPLSSDTRPASSANAKSRFGTARTINYVETYEQVQNLPIPRKPVGLDHEPQFSNRDIRQQIQNYNQFVTSPLTYKNYPSEYDNRLPHGNSVVDHPSSSRSRYSLSNVPHSTSRISDGSVERPRDVYLPHSANRNAYSNASGLPRDSNGVDRYRERLGVDRLRNYSGSVNSEQFGHYGGDVALNRKSKATVQDLFKIVQLQNEQLQLLQAQVAQLLSNQMKQNHETSLRDYHRNDGADGGNRYLGNASRSVGEESAMSSSGVPQRIATQFDPNIYQQASDTRADSYGRPKQNNPQFGPNTGGLSSRKRNVLHPGNVEHVPSFANSQTNTSLLWDKNMQLSVETVESDRRNKPTNISTVCQKVSIGVMTSFVDPLFGNAGANAVQQIHETRREFVQHGSHLPEELASRRYDDVLPRQIRNDTKHRSNNDTQPERYYDVDGNQTAVHSQRLAYENRSSNETKAHEKNTRQRPSTAAIDGLQREFASPEDSHLTHRQRQIPNEPASRGSQSYDHHNVAPDNRARSHQGGNLNESISRRERPDGSQRDKCRDDDRRLVDTPTLGSENNRRIQTNVARGTVSSGEFAAGESRRREVADRRNGDDRSDRRSRKVELTPETRLKDLWAEEDSRPSEGTPRETHPKEVWTRNESRETGPSHTRPYQSTGDNARRDADTVRQGGNVGDRTQATSSNAHHCPGSNERLPAGTEDRSDRHSDDHRCPGTPPSPESPESAPGQREATAGTINVLQGLERLAPFESLSEQADESLAMPDLDVDRLLDHQPTPVPSVHISIGEYKMSDDEGENTSFEGEEGGGDSSDDGERVGWTFYHNVMGQVNQMLKPGTEAAETENRGESKGDRGDKDNAPVSEGDLQHSRGRHDTDRRPTADQSEDPRHACHVDTQRPPIVRKQGDRPAVQKVTMQQLVEQCEADENNRLRDERDRESERENRPEVRERREMEAWNVPKTGERRSRYDQFLRQGPRNDARPATDRSPNLEGNDSHGRPSCTGHPVGDDIRDTRRRSRSREEPPGRDDDIRPRYQDDDPHRGRPSRFRDESSGDEHNVDDGPRSDRPSNRQRFHDDAHLGRPLRRERYHDESHRIGDAFDGRPSNDRFLDESSGGARPDNGIPRHRQHLNQQHYHDESYQDRHRIDDDHHNGQPLDHRFRDEPSGDRHDGQRLNERRYHDQRHNEDVPRHGRQSDRRGYRDGANESYGGGRADRSVRQATMERLQQMGISFCETGENGQHDADIRRPTHEPAFYPRANATGFNADLSESSDVSMRMNALALKYLKDDQLSEYARLATNTAGSGEGMTVCNIATKSTNLSFATLSYLERYQLIPPGQHPQGN